MYWFFLLTNCQDPLSRRHIWNIILAERSKRSMVITTHFLDESEVLADHITIISRGHLKCRGPPATLKSQFGGGYRVHAPYGHHSIRIADVHSFIHQDRIVYNTPDATAAAQLMATLTHRGERDVQIAGPTIEDVFMKLSDELPETFMDDPASYESSKAVEAGDVQLQQLSPAQPASFWTQVRVLIYKRGRILRRHYWPYIFVLALPLAITPALNVFLQFYHEPSCVDVLADAYYPAPFRVMPEPGVRSNTLRQPASMVFGPPAQNASMYRVLSNFAIGQGFSAADYANNVAIVGSSGDFQSTIQTRFANITPGAIWMGDDASRPTIAYTAQPGIFAALSMLSLYSQVRSGVQIKGAQQFLSSLFSVCHERLWSLNLELTDEIANLNLSMANI
jgi:ATP-binding cassette, subfamily A (ABC1), member 3